MPLPTTWSSDWTAAGAGAPGANWQSYNFYVQLLLAIAERWKCQGDCLGKWPAGTTEWGGGYVDGITTDGAHVTITCRESDGATPNWVDEADGGRKRWVAYNKPNVPFLHGSYRIAIDMDGDDYNRAVYAEIVDNGEDWVKVVDDGTWELNRTLASLLGKNFAIALSSSGSCQRPFWAERRFGRPNDFELEMGTITSATTGSVTDDRPSSLANALCPKSWAEDQWVGHDLMTKVGGRWVRIPITGNTANTITFAAQAHAPAGEYWVIKSGDWWRPEWRTWVTQFRSREGQAVLQRNYPDRKWSFWQWYYGMLKAYWTHNAATDDPSELAHAAQAEPGPIQLLLGLTLCEELDAEVYDVDYVVDPVDECNTCPNRFLNPNLYFGVRGIQMAIEQLSSGFCERKTYTTEDAIVNFVPATWHEYFNPQNSTRGVVTGRTERCVGETWVDPDTGETLCAGTIHYDAQVTWQDPLPLDPIEVHWALLDADGSVLRYGYLGSRSVLTAKGTAKAAEFVAPYSFQGEDVGRTVVISWGWRRRIPLIFQHMYRRDTFIPDTGETGAAFPPDEENPGYYNRVLPSTTYAEYNKFGALVTSARAFQNGDAARYVGDNLNDPSTTAPVTGASQPDHLAYWDRQYQGVPAHQSLGFNPPTTGTITSATANSFTDDEASWWETGGGTIGGASIVHSGTATGGSTTSLTDATKVGYWAFARPDYLHDQILEVEVEPDVWESRPIETVNAGTGTVTIYGTVDPFGASTNGKAWRIRQAGYVKNRWIDRPVTITRTDGTTVTVTAKWNNDNTIFFTDDVTLEAGWTYSIENHLPGGVWHRHGGAWKRPYDSGVAQDARGEHWHANQLENLPHYHEVPGDSEGGKFRMGDIVDADFLKMLYDAINSLVWTAKDVVWRGRQDVAVPEWNYHFGTNVMSTSPDESCTDWHTYARHNWTSSTETTESNAPPFSGSIINLKADLVGSGGGERRYAYAVVSNLCDGLAKKVSIMGKTLLDPFDDGTATELGFRSPCDDDPPCSSPAANRLRQSYETFGDFVGSPGLHQWGELVSSGVETGTEVVKKCGYQGVDGTTASNWQSATHLPTLPDCPPYPVGWCPPPAEEGCLWAGSAIIHGYYLGKTRALVKWNVPGGLGFVDVVD